MRLPVRSRNTLGQIASRTGSEIGEARALKTSYFSPLLMHFTVSLFDGNRLTAAFGCTSAR